MKHIFLLVFLWYTSYSSAQSVFFMYDNPNEQVLRCWSPHGWEYAAVNSPKNRGYFTSDSLVTIITNLKELLKDTTITDYTYTGVEILVVSERKGYGYDVFVCGSCDGDLIEVNGKPYNGGRLLKNILYYIVYNHVYVARQGKMTEKNVNKIIDRYLEWSCMKPHDIPLVNEIFDIQPQWIPKPPDIDCKVE